MRSEEKGDLMREGDNGTVALASYWKEGHTSTEGEHSWCRPPFFSFLLKQDPVYLEKRAACRHRRRQLLSLTLVEGTLPQPPLLSFKLGHPRRTLTLQRDYQARRVIINHYILFTLDKENMFSLPPCCGNKSKGTSAYCKQGPIHFCGFREDPPFSLSVGFS